MMNFFLITHLFSKAFYLQITLRESLIKWFCHSGKQRYELKLFLRAAGLSVFLVTCFKNF